MEDMELIDIKKYWEGVGQQFSIEGGKSPTSRDSYLGILEMDNILNYLEMHHVALEICCGDGSHTVQYAKRVKRLLGIDIAESLISIAKMRAITESIQNVDFVVGSVLDIKKIYHAQQFNCIISQRCLINLSKWQHQQDVILQVYGLLQKGGLFLLTEGFQEELDNLNTIRQKFGLSEIKVVNYNRNLIRKDFEAFINQYFDIVEICYYGTYLFLSRVFYPFAVLPNEPKHDSKLNKIAMKISQTIPMSSLEKYSYNLFYVLKKK